MIGVVLVSHGELAPEALSSAVSVLGHDVPAMAAVDARTDDTLDTLRARLAAAVASVEQGDGTIILADMFGDSACNVSLSLAEQGRVEVLTGVNLPIVLKVVSARETMTLEKLAAFLVDYGRSHLLRVSARDRRRKAGGG
jgi:PTS system mannose-specific IIA component